MGEDPSIDPLRLGVIRASGPDAGEFLRAQLSNDVARLGPDRHFLAAWCDPKGRTRLIMRVAALPEAYLLIVPRALIDSALNRLRMYVLRLNVTLDDASAEYDLAGLIDEADAPEPDQTVTHDGHIRLGLPGSLEHERRALVLHPADAAPPAESVTTDSQRWLLSEIDAGLPQISAATQGEFVPQMLNLHWLLAVDFAKGCYPGQEVIARLHYRGRLTRRVFRLGWRGTRPAPGAPVHDDQNKDVGQILQAADQGRGHGRALAVLRIEAAVSGNLRVEGVEELKTLELPYATAA